MIINVTRPFSSTHFSERTLEKVTKISTKYGRHGSIMFCVSWSVFSVTLSKLHQRSTLLISFHAFEHPTQQKSSGIAHGDRGYQKVINVSTP